jgi:hypothetical protein
LSFFSPLLWLASRLSVKWPSGIANQLQFVGRTVPMTSSGCRRQSPFAPKLDPAGPFLFREARKRCLVLLYLVYRGSEVDSLILLPRALLPRAWSAADCVVGAFVV